MKTRYSLTILATAFVMVLLFSKDKKSRVKEAAVQQAEVAVDSKKPILAIDQPKAAPPNPNKTELPTCPMPQIIVHEIVCVKVQFLDFDITIKGK